MGTWKIVARGFVAWRRLFSFPLSFPASPCTCTPPLSQFNHVSPLIRQHAGATSRHQAAACLGRSPGSNETPPPPPCPAFCFLPSSFHATTALQVCQYHQQHTSSSKAPPPPCPPKPPSAGSSAKPPPARPPLLPPRLLPPAPPLSSTLRTTLPSRRRNPPRTWI